MKTDTCGQDLNKQNNNARTSNIFIHFSDVPAGMWREILSSDVLRRWRDFFYYTHNTVPSQTATFWMCLKFICQNVTRVSTRSSEKQLQVSLKWNILFSSNIHKNKKNKTVVTSTVNPLLSPPPPLPSQISPPFFRGKKVHKPPTLLRPHSPPLFTFYCQMLNCINQWQR